MNQPPPLNYATPMPPAPKPPIPHLWRKFFGGLLGACGVSALIWFLAPWNSDQFTGYVWPILVIVLLVLKLGAGITLTCIRNWRPVGIALLIAIPLGFLIMFFGCAANLSMNFH